MGWSVPRQERKSSKPRVQPLRRRKPLPPIHLPPLQVVRPSPPPLGQETSHLSLFNKPRSWRPNLDFAGQSPASAHPCLAGPFLQAFFGPVFSFAASRDRALSRQSFGFSSALDELAQTQNRLWNLRHETLPALRHRAQSSIYRAIVQRRAQRAERTRSFGGGIVAYFFGNRRRLGSGRASVFSGAGSFVRRTRAIRGPADGPDNAPRGPMASSSWGAGGAGTGDGSYVPGSRRKKAYEWLKAANELGQAYTARWTGQPGNSQDDYYHTPGAFPDVEIARSGDEEMVLFPSYGRRLTPKKESQMQTRQRRDSWSDTIDDYRGVAKWNRRATKTAVGRGGDCKCSR
ncbi:hypothetical protein N7470_007167 [Penicillium chermesinum]|nr:hypothetical protein N7470_007167 [Penicillium chermesinum]